MIEIPQKTEILDGRLLNFKFLIRFESGRSFDAVTVWWQRMRAVLQIRQAVPRCGSRCSWCGTAKQKARKETISSSSAKTRNVFSKEHFWSNPQRLWVDWRASSICRSIPSVFSIIICARIAGQTFWQADFRLLFFFQSKPLFWLIKRQKNEAKLTPFVWEPSESHQSWPESVLLLSNEQLFKWFWIVNEAKRAFKESFFAPQVEGQFGNAKFSKSMKFHLLFLQNLADETGTIRVWAPNAVGFVEETDQMRFKI